MFGFSQHYHIRLHWKSSLRRCDQPYCVYNHADNHPLRHPLFDLDRKQIFCAVASSFRSDRFHFLANNPDRSGRESPRPILRLRSDGRGVDRRGRPPQRQPQRPVTTGVVELGAHIVEAAPISARKGGRWDL
jgi:hypothetical protein